MKRSIVNSNFLYWFIGLVIIFASWSIFSAAQNNQFVYPSLLQILGDAGKMLVSWDTMKLFLYSLGRLLIVLCLGFFTGLIFSFIYVIKPQIFNVFRPILIIMKAAPLAIISIYIWLTAGSQKGPFVIGYFMIAPIIIEGMINAISTIDKEYINEIRTTDVSIFKKFFMVYIPLIAPYILVTFLQTFGLGIKVLMMSEYICQTNNSVGKLICSYKDAMDFSNMLAILIIIVVIVVIFDALISKMKSKIIIDK